MRHATAGHFSFSFFFFFYLLFIISFVGVCTAGYLVEHARPSPSTATHSTASSTNTSITTIVGRCNVQAD
jgi:hypothetical protein